MIESLIFIKPLIVDHFFNLWFGEQNRALRALNFKYLGCSDFIDKILLETFNAEFVLT